MLLEIVEVSGHSVSKHWHNGFEVIFILSGSMTVNINNRDYKLQNGGFAVVNSKTIHSTVCRGTCKYLLIQIPYETIKKNIPDIDIIMIRCICTSEENTKGNFIKIRNILTKLKMHYEAPRDCGYLLMLNSLIYNLLYHLVINFKTSIDPVMKEKADRNIQRLGVVLQYVRQHYAENISLNDAAHIVALNREYFSRFFKRYMGMTFMAVSYTHLRAHET